MNFGWSECKKTVSEDKMNQKLETKNREQHIAVILAGGIGSRVGADIPKQFIEVLGKPVIAYTIEAFQKHEDVDAILVVCVQEWMDTMAKIRDAYGLTKLKWITEGGATFQESVMKGVEFLEDKVAEDDILLVHFAASPFIEEPIITDAIRVCREKGNAISATDFFLLSGKKVKETSVADPENYTTEYVNRDTVACMSTPHAFRYGFIDEMYREAVKTGVIDEVEPHTTTLMYRMGKPIYFSYGTQTNIKITRAEDLDLFEGYVLMKKRREENRPE